MGFNVHLADLNTFALLFPTQLVDSMLWMSFERQINAFRTTILGLEPLRVGNGGWNHLNTMKVRRNLFSSLCIPCAISAQPARKWSFTLASIFNFITFFIFLKQLFSFFAPGSLREDVVPIVCAEAQGLAQLRGCGRYFLRLRGTSTRCEQ